jgi:hypothetical protein
VANGGLLRQPLDMPDFRDFAVEVKSPDATLTGNVPTMGNFLREVMRLDLDYFRVFSPDEIAFGEDAHFQDLPAAGCHRHGAVPPGSCHIDPNYHLAAGIGQAPARTLQRGYWK